MLAIHSQESNKKIVTAPQSSFVIDHGIVNLPSPVISVEINEDESVEWIWTIYPNGQQVVTGFSINKKNTIKHK